MNGTKLIGKAFWLLPLLYFFAWAGLPMFYTGTTSTAVVTMFGAVVGTADNGLHFKLPFQEAHSMDTQLIKLPIQTRAPTKDLQEVTVNVDLQVGMTPAAVGGIYTTVGGFDDVKRVILAPGLEEVFKAVTAQYTLAELLEKRDPASAQSRDALEEWVKTSLKAVGLQAVVKVGTLQLSNIDYSAAFKQAVATRSEVVQGVPEAKNNRREKIAQAQGEAAKIKRDADARAASIHMETDAEAGAILNKVAQLNAHPELPCYILLKKWDGKMPSVQGGAPVMPFYKEACGQ